MSFMGASGVVPDNHSKILEILGKNENNLCADCGMTLSVDTAWAVLSYGIFVCDDCKLVHIQQENHYRPVEQGAASQVTVTGILPTSCYLRWEEKDFEQMNKHGNKSVNMLLLSETPPWHYRPMHTDGIKHKEFWIKYKYGKGPGASEEIPKTANKSFNGIQFSRLLPKGDVLPCCAVLQGEKLYLTSGAKSVEIAVADIESVLVNSKRIGKDNGVQLTYKSTVAEGDDQQSTITYTYLQHENMETVLDWINLILYTKYKLMQENYPTYKKEELAGMLNCVMVKESYMSAAGHGLIYVSLSEARIACFRHHLDEKPLFHLTVAQALNLTAAQYLEALAKFFEMDVSKMHGYDDWNGALEHALRLNKLAYLADNIIKANNPSLQLKSVAEKVEVPVETTTTVPERVVATSENVELVKEVTTSPEPQEERNPSRTVTPRGMPNDKAEEKSNKKYECYPPIGPMGEMGKVARGELPPEAIRPPPPKIDPSRVQLFGVSNPMNAAVAPPPLAHPGLSMPNISAMNMNQQNSLNSNTDCYPPISGPVREMPEVFQPMPRMSANGTNDNYPVIDKFDPMSSGFRNQDRRSRSQMPYDGDAGQFSRVHSTNGVQSPTDVHSMQQFPLSRSTSWNQPGRTNLDWQMNMQSAHRPVNFRNSTSSHEQLIMENLIQQWASAERKLLTLIHNSYVPTSNMAAAGLDANSLAHTQTCITELFDLLWKKRYDLALSFLRGFREVFSRSTNLEIRNHFIGVGELDTMKEIFLQQGREKFLRSGFRSASSWKPNDILENSWTGASTAPIRDHDYSPWGLQVSQASGPSPKYWGSTPSTPLSAPSLGLDSWSMAGGMPSTTVQSHAGMNGNRPFNRAPSRPVSQSRASFSEGATDGSYDSKASSNSSASPPGMRTPPISLDPTMPSPALTGIETTLRNLFLNTSSSGSTLWN